MLAKKALYTILVCVLWTVTSYAMAGQYRTDDGYVIHYNALSTEILPAETLRSYNIQRSKKRALLNISVRKGDKNSLLHTKAVKATVTAKKTNLVGTEEILEMELIEEGDGDSKAVYYISDFRITNQETLRFIITVVPENQGKEHEIKFNQQFFVD